jgi:hypothetical protein
MASVPDLVTGDGEHIIETPRRSIAIKENVQKIVPKSLVARIRYYIPILTWLPSYSRNDILSDVVAGRNGMKEKTFQISLRPIVLDERVLQLLDGIFLIVFFNHLLLAPTQVLTRGC